MPEQLSALKDIRILELTGGTGGSYCGKLFAGLGADVVKIEPPAGDPIRREGPFPGDTPDPERSGLFLHLNTGKRSAVLDLQTTEGRSQFDRLLVYFDVLIVDYHRSRLRSLGIDLQDLRQRFPRLVIVTVTTFGISGPYADYLGGELNAYAVSGYMMLTGALDREPTKAYGSLVQYEAGAHAALGTMAALFSRERDGRGQIVDVSAMEAGTFLLGGVEQQAYFYGKVFRRNGTRLIGLDDRYSYPSTIRPCKDGYVHCHSNNRHLDLLGVLIPNPRLLAPDLLETMMGHADEIDAIIDPWLADKERREIVTLAQELRLPFTEVMTPGEVLDDPHHQERGSFVQVDHPGFGPLLQPGPPFRLHGTPWRTLPAPILGQHTREVLVAADTAGQSAEPVAGQEILVPPLRGIRVIDFTTAVAGPLATALLADLGAEVIKVEDTGGRPLHAAGVAPLREEGEDRYYDRLMLFNELNHGKRSVTLDVARREGREIFLRLTGKAEVIVENFAPRVMVNLGLEYEELRRVRPDVIMVSMPAFGLSGAYRDRVAYGPGIDAMSGLSHLTGYPDGPPMKPGNFFCDQNAGVHTAFAILVGLWHRSRTGEGQRIEMPMIEGEFQILADAYMDYTMNGRERSRMGNDHPWMAPHDVYPCRGEDAWVAIAIEDDDQWRALCRIIDRTDLAMDPRYVEIHMRHSHRHELRAAIARWTGGRTHYEAQQELQGAGIPATAVLNALELLSDPHVVARQGFEYVHAPGSGPTPYPRMAFVLSRTPAPIAKPAPRFAEDNDYVLRQLLGMSAAEVAALESAAITARAPLAQHG